MIDVIEYYNWLTAEWINGYYGNGVFLLIAIIAFIYLYATCETLRYKFLLPVFLMLFITVNPILHMYIFRRMIFWRLLWMLPTAVLIAAAIVVLLKRTNKIWMKYMLLLIVTSFVVSQGQYMFSYGVFFPRSNWEKISQETIEVCDYLLSVEDAPRVVLPECMLAEARQYAPEISMMYGRNIHGYITSVREEYVQVYKQLESDVPDYDYVFYWVTHYKYNFIVVDQNKGIEMDCLQKYGYKELENIAGYIIYYNDSLK